MELCPWWCHWMERLRIRAARREKGGDHRTACGASSDGTARPQGHVRDGKGDVAARAARSETIRRTRTHRPSVCGRHRSTGGCPKNATANW